MQVMTFGLVVVVLLQFVVQPCVAELVCQPKGSCAECLRSPGCAWCKQQGFLKPGESNERRCDLLNSLKTRECEEIIGQLGETSRLKDSDLNSDPDNVVQLKPQSLHVKLQLGVPQEFKVEFRRAEGYPIDLYYLMDLSYSMKDDLEKIKNLGQNILNKLQEVTKSVRIGFGSFVDKEKLPYVSQVKSRREKPCPIRMDNCQPAFTFQNVLPLTYSAREFKNEVSKQSISGNLDSPEAGLDAIMQAAVCQKEINWKNVTRILVYTSDDTFHMAGDGRLSGIFRPHDGQCHLSSDGFYDGKTFDYPSIGHLSRVLQANNIQLIFAVTEKSVPAYKALSSLIPQSVVGVLEDDSSNVVQLISEAYGNLSSTLLLEQDQTPTGLQVSYKSHCKTGEPSEWQSRGECTGIKVNEKVEFTIRLNASECLNGPQEVLIRMQGISEVLKVKVETLCDCNCDTEENSTHCNGKGTHICGVCSCNEGFLGQHCECEHNLDMTSTEVMLKNCRQNNVSQVCSGHGYCECGKCTCRGPFDGSFCECDSTSCERHDGKICNEKGKCICGTCDCTESGYEGRACGCSTDKKMCQNEHGLLCSGHGKCRCNQCECNPGFVGQHCSDLVSPCQTYVKCVDCTVQSELYSRSSNCSVACEAVQMVHLKDNHELPCVHKDVIYDVTLNNDGTVKIQYANLPGTVDKTKIIIGTSVSAIVFIGIAIIIIYKVLLELYDLREYRSFIKAQQQTDWKETNNPLFQGATTTVLNPLHSQDS
ncbi:integrin beta-7 isoform X1 [Astyanax mexicanus]|uniref:integrin beta-7 isoform X1 n=1 Tax=Astyanax mexicanus TaxID=7994 RepID=UPI0020CAF48B|nr:integrin beta-7 isoform X1 [Astyanax mexicanus]